jgi:thioredoxin-like negative regulator of GroEL
MTSRLSLPARGLLAAALLTLAGWAQALTIQPFTAAALDAARQAGQPVAVLFHADWCPTCKQQERALAAMAREPGLEVLLLVADYDKERDLRRAMAVRTQSTLVVFRGSAERARLAGDTDAARLRAALKAAL